MMSLMYPLVTLGSGTVKFFCHSCTNRHKSSRLTWTAHPTKNSASVLKPTTLSTWFTRSAPSLAKFNSF